MTIEPVATQYTLSPYPEEDLRSSTVAVHLSRRPDDRWAVIRSNRYQYLADDGTWGWGPDFDDDWIRRHWHTWDRAVELAQQALTDWYAHKDEP